jgi:hypothetical protein
LYETLQEDDYELNKKIIKLLNPKFMEDINPKKRIFIEDFSSNEKIIKLGKCRHILDLYRKSMIHEKPSHKTRIPKLTKMYACLEKGGEDHIIRSARKLQEGGIRFKKSETRSLRDFSFKRGVLRLPVLNLDDKTEYTFLNLIAFERLHVGAGNEVTSFVFLMDIIVDSAMDVSILNKKGILTSALGRDEIVADMFNSMSKEIPVERDGEFDKVREAMYRFCNKPWKSWRSSLIQTYFRNPWAMVSLVAAIFLFGLTIIQTIYAILSFYHNC